MDRWNVPERARRKAVSLEREFRRVPTRSEELLWESLRSRRLDGVKFRRQQPIGPFVLDFFAPEKRLVVEVDGGTHMSSTQQARDRERQALLESLGLRVLRVEAGVVEHEHERALEMIRAACTGADRSSPAAVPSTD